MQLQQLTPRCPHEYVYRSLIILNLVYVERIYEYFLDGHKDVGGRVRTVPVMWLRIDTDRCTYVIKMVQKINFLVLEVFMYLAFLLDTLRLSNCCVSCISIR